MVPLGKSHLPDARVRLCAVAQGQAYIFNALQNLGIAVIEVPPHSALAQPIQTHSDLLLHDLGNGLVAVADCWDKPTQKLRAYGYAVKELGRPLSPRYPGDVPLNCFALGRVLYCNPQVTAPELLAFYQAHGYRIEPVRQGYTKCSVCIVSGEAVITADAGLGEAARKNGVDVLLIRPGHILLPGYDYGFIGGCCGLLGRDLLAFAGDVGTHPDGDKLLAFCRNYGVHVDCLMAGHLLDIGGILPLAVEQG